MSPERKVNLLTSNIRSLHRLLSSLILRAANTFPTTSLVNGHFGVDVFFVLSGILTVSNLLASPPPSRLSRYFIKRIFRIMPPFYITYAIYCLIATQVNAAAKCEGYKVASR